MPNRLLAALCVVCFVAPASAQTCKASYYGAGEKLSRLTANGEVFQPSHLTAAHRSYRFGTLVRVTYRGRSVTVRINDRGPAARLGRCIDVSAGAARAIGLTRAGVATVSIEVVR